MHGSRKVVKAKIGKVARTSTSEIAQGFEACQHHRKKEMSLSKALRRSSDDNSRLLFKLSQLIGPLMSISLTYGCGDLG